MVAMAVAVCRLLFVVLSLVALAACSVRPNGCNSAELCSGGIAILHGHGR